jgi:hypothetical protein
MQQKTITIEIDEQGNSSIDLDGFQGQGCWDFAKDLQGSDAVKQTRNKRDFYAHAITTTRQQRSQ